MHRCAKERRWPVGAELLPDGTVHLRIWAPTADSVQVVLETADGQPEAALNLTPEPAGYFQGPVPDATAGSLYRLRLNGGETGYPDPASRFQPDGPHGPSQIVDPHSFTWTDAGWPGVSPEGMVIYEMHVGTFTPAGTWRAAAGELQELAELGITCIELMPVADFPGRFGWGYDGVNLFAPTRLYGSPDDFRHFVNEAHSRGIAVILDVVYNHFGPDGNYLKLFSEAYFTDRYQNEWGEAINFDGPDSSPVREFFIANAGYWIEEFHLDGLRLDATQQVYDASEPNILQEITSRVRGAAPGRRTFIVAENEPQQTRLVRPVAAGGFGIDALWNDDFHHSAMVALTGRNEAYYTDYLGTAQEFISAAKWGYLYQGQRYSWQNAPRGTSALDLPPTSFVTFLQNHDQVANSDSGLRVQALTSPGRLRALTALLLLGPGTPMLFQGEEFASSRPFYYFADHAPELAQLVAEGRGKFISQFPSFATPVVQAILKRPAASETFAACKLDFTERVTHAQVYELHRDLIHLRQGDPVFRAPRRRGVDGAVLRDDAFVLRFFADDSADRLLIVNLGRDLHLDPAPEPLLAPPPGMHWHVAWSSEDVRYGGHSHGPVESEANWRIPGEAAVVLFPDVGTSSPEAPNHG